MDDDQDLSSSDAYLIASKVVDMADRVSVMDKVAPGAMAKSSFSIDDVEFDIIVQVKRDG